MDVLVFSPKKIFLSVTETLLTKKVKKVTVKQSAFT